MINKVKVSVLMAVYDTHLFYVKRAIDSVLKQDFQDFELIVIDDGSCFEKSEAILGYVAKHENKIAYIRHSNRGQAQSINRGILISSGDFITVIDGDDEYKPHHLSSCLREINNFDLIASTVDAVVETEDDYFVIDRHDHQNLIHIDNCILFGTLFGRKSVFTNFKFKDGYAADADFYHNAETVFRVNKVNLRTYIYYRNMPNSISASLKNSYTKNMA